MSGSGQRQESDHHRKLIRKKKDENRKRLGMFFSQDPMPLLYQQSPYMQGPAMPHTSPSRPSFLIDDLLVRRQSAYLVPKPQLQQDPHSHEQTQIASASGSSFKFGMPGIFSRGREEHSSVYQGNNFYQFKAQKNVFGHTKHPHTLRRPLGEDMILIGVRVTRLENEI